MRRHLRAPAVVASVIAALTAVQAYVTTGHTWSARQVPFYVNPANQDVPEANALAAIRTGAQAWTDQTQADFSFYFAGTTTAASLENNGRNEVFFRDEASGSTAATAYYWWDSDGRLLDADIVFWDGGFTFTTTGLGCTSAVYIEDIATHEFGHALGLSHSPDNAATMYPRIGLCKTKWRSLAPDDIAGVEALYPVAALPDEPTALTAEPLPSAPWSTMALTWVDASSNEDWFLVERSTDGNTFAQIAQVPSGTQAYSDGDLTASTTYAYRVRASNAGGFSGYSNVATATTAAASAPPAAPSGPKPATGATGVSLTPQLAWSAAGATTYDVYFGTTADPALVSSGQAASSWVPGTLLPGTTYSWRIVAINAGGSTSGPTWSFTVKIPKRATQ
jgi:hypothetical protein